MKFVELKKNLINGLDSNIFYIEGDDAYFRERSKEFLAEKYVTEPQMNITVFEGESLTSNIDSFFSAVNQYPFLSEKRMVVVKEFYPKNDFFNKFLLKLFEKPIQETILVFINSFSSDVLKKTVNSTFIDCNKADITTLSKYIIREVNKSGEKITTETAEKICEFCLLDMTKIVNETKKLINYSFDTKIIDNNSVENLCYKDSEYQLYEMTDCIGKKKKDKALTIIKDLLGKGEAPQRLLVSIYNYFSRMLNISLSELSDKELAKELNIKEYAVKKTREQSKNFKKKTLKNNVDILADYDYKIKSGRINFNDALNIAVLKMMI